MSTGNADRLAEQIKTALESGYQSPYVVATAKKNVDALAALAKQAPEVLQPVAELRDHDDGKRYVHALDFAAMLDLPIGTKLYTQQAPEAAPLSQGEQSMNKTPWFSAITELPARKGYYETRCDECVWTGSAFWDGHAWQIDATEKDGCSFGQPCDSWRGLYGAPAAALGGKGSGNADQA